MKKIGIICEYNPFHNGHVYHINKIKTMYPDSIIILVMSSCFTMRGEISLLTKWDKTRLALTYGINLVIELPIYYATNSADIFSEGAVKILSLLGCDYLIFGSESDDINYLYECAQVELNNQNYDNLVKEYLSQGYNYPNSMNKALEILSNKKIIAPNDLLGLSYVKAIIKQKASIIPLTIKRTNDYHERNIHEKITSSTSIRKALKQKIDVQETLPQEVFPCLIKEDIENNYFYLLKYKILSDINHLNDYLDVEEGIDNLIKKHIIKDENLEDFLKKIKTKRYTYNRLNRILIHILLGLKKDNIDKLKEINYLRVLGFDKEGQNYLKAIKKKINIPIITNYSDIDDDNLQLELYITNIYLQIIHKENLLLEELKSIPIIH